MQKKTLYYLFLAMCSINTAAASALFVLDTGDSEKSFCKGSTNTAFTSAKINLRKTLESSAYSNTDKLAVLTGNNSFKIITTQSRFKVNRFLKDAKNNKNSLLQLLRVINHAPSLTKDVSHLKIFTTDQTTSMISLATKLKELKGIKDIEINFFSLSPLNPMSLKLTDNKVIQINYYTCPEINGWKRYQQQIFATLASAISVQTGLALNEINLHSKFDSDFGMDSVAAFQFQSRSAIQHGLELDQSDQLHRLSDLVSYIADTQLRQGLVDKDGNTVKSRSLNKTSKDSAYLQTIYFATNRSPSKQNDLNFSGLRQLTNNNIHYGMCKVAIPKSHKPGRDTTSLLSLEMFDDPKEHIHIREVSSSSEDHFYTSINTHLNKKSVQDSMQNDIVIFIHGFNVPFNQAVRRTAQIAYDTQFKGIPMLFSWPSDGQLSAYMSDREDATWSIQHMEQFLNGVIKKAKYKKIHLIAHSMGNQVLIGALNQMALKDNRPKEVIFGNIIFAAPDFDAELFKHQISPRVTSLSESITIYTSKKDTALNISNKVNNSKRLGLSITKLPNVDLIDASNIEVSPWSVPAFHSYYATKKKVIDDIVATLRGTPPANRNLVSAKKDKYQYWLIKD